MTEKSFRFYKVIILSEESTFFCEKINTISYDTQIFLLLCVTQDSKLMMSLFATQNNHGSQSNFGEID